MNSRSITQKIELPAYLVKFLYKEVGLSIGETWELFPYGKNQMNMVAIAMLHTPISLVRPWGDPRIQKATITVGCKLSAYEDSPRLAQNFHEQKQWFSFSRFLRNEFLARMYGYIEGRNLAGKFLYDVLKDVPYVGNELPKKVYHVTRKAAVKEFLDLYGITDDELSPEATVKRHQRHQKGVELPYVSFPEKVYPYSISRKEGTAPNIILSDEERNMLDDIRIRDRRHQVRNKALGILFLSKRLSLADVANLLDLPVATVRNWLNSYHEQGIMSVIEAHKPRKTA